MTTKKVLIGSPIYQRPQILAEFLQSLKELDKEGLTVHYYFIDDNSDHSSSHLLNKFSKEETVVVRESDKSSQYVCNENNHKWREDLIWKVAEFKDEIIKVALENNYDYLFLIDSDIVLHPNTLQQLILTKKDIISEIFWTKWQPNDPELPQVWLYDQYQQYSIRRGEKCSQDEINSRFTSFIERLRVPGVYEVGGLGACTLISRIALVKGVNFKEIKNITFWGEDRHFCIRAAALGLSLHVDTHYPAYHIYRESDLSGVQLYKKNNVNVYRENTKKIIHDIVRQGIKSLGTFDYRWGYANNWTPYFSEEMKRILLCQIENDIENNIEKAVTVKASVKDISVIEIVEDSSYKAEFTLINDGMLSGTSFYEEYYCEASLTNIDNKWLIESFKIVSPKQSDNMPKVRHAKIKENKITLSMIVKNEADRYLARVLESYRGIIDEAVIIDDGCTDNSIEICKGILNEIPLKIISNSHSKFSNEVELRKQQWEETIKTQPDWILNLDADEIFEDKFYTEVRELINQQDYDVLCFRLYDFWNEEYYRDDQYWSAHQSFRPFLVRYQPNFGYIWKETSQHCGRFPVNITQLPTAKASHRLKHYGWAREVDRINKYKRYQQLDPESKYGWKEQYESILDKKPNLIKWTE